MQSKKSFFNLNLYLKNLKRFWPLWALLSLAMCIGPATIIMTSRITFYASSYEKPFSVYANLLTTFVPALMFVDAIVTAMCVWGYLYNTKSAYSIHALPVSRNELFVTNFLSGLSLMAIPTGIGALLEIIAVTTVHGWSGSGMFSLIVIGLIELVFFFSFATFVAFLVGHIVMLPMAYAFLNFVFMLIESEFSYIISGYCPGVLRNYEGKLSFLSPLAWIYDNIYDITVDYETTLFGFGKSFLLLLAAAGLIALSLFIYNKKKLELSGHAITVKVLEPIVLCIITVIGTVTGSIIFTYLFNYSSADHLYEITGFVIVYMMISATISFFLISVIVRGTVKVFNKKNFFILGCTFLTIVVINLAMKADVLGLINKVPTAPSVKYVVYNVDHCGQLMSDKPDTIESVIEVNKLMAESARTYDKRYYQYYSYGDYDSKYDIENYLSTDLSIEYVLQDGRRIKRDYEGYRLLENDRKIEDTLTYKVVSLSRTEEYVKNMLHMGDSNAEIYGMYIYSWYSPEDSYDYERSVSPKNFDAIIDAISKDAAAGNVLLRNSYASDGSFIMLEITYDIKPSDTNYVNHYDTVSVNVTKETVNLNKTLIDAGILTEEVLDKILSQEMN